MQIIRSAEALVRASLPSDLRHLIDEHVVRLAPYGTLEDLAEFLIIEATDTLAEIEEGYGRQLVMGGGFAFPVEWIVRHSHYWEVGWIVSDDGFGLVMFIEHASANRVLIAACRQAAADIVKRL